VGYCCGWQLVRHLTFVLIACRGRRPDMVSRTVAMRARRIPTFVLSHLGLADAVHAFEVDGFVSGMPIEDARKLVQASPTKMRRGG